MGRLKPGGGLAKGVDPAEIEVPLERGPPPPAADLLLASLVDQPTIDRAELVLALEDAIRRAAVAAWPGGREHERDPATFDSPRLTPHWSMQLGLDDPSACPSTERKQRRGRLGW
jgi:hypothetical protein